MPKPDPEPFSKATFGGGGVPRGSPEADLGRGHVGGRHGGAILEDPVQTLERLERPARPTPAKKDDAKV